MRTVTDWLIDWLIDEFIGRLFGWLVDWLIDWLIDWSIGRLIGWLIDWLIDCWSPLCIFLCCLRYRASTKKGKMGYEEAFLRFLKTMIQDVDRRIDRGRNRLESTRLVAVSFSTQKLWWNFCRHPENKKYLKWTSRVKYCESRYFTFCTVFVPGECYGNEARRKSARLYHSNWGTGQGSTLCVCVWVFLAIFRRERSTFECDLSFTDRRRTWVVKAKWRRRSRNCASPTSWKRNGIKLLP